MFTQIWITPTDDANRISFSLIIVKHSSLYNPTSVRSLLQNSPMIFHWDNLIQERPAEQLIEATISARNLALTYYIEYRNKRVSPTTAGEDAVSDSGRALV